MVRAIVVKDKDKTFYGTREALYGISLPDEEAVNPFADDLEKTIIEINNIEKNSSSLSLELRKLDNTGRSPIKIGNEASHLGDELREALKDIYNVGIFQTYSKDIIANFFARFSGPKFSTDPAKDRGLMIYPFSVPNTSFWFNPAPLYELGEKWGKLESGQDFDVTVNNYRKINNR